MKSENPHDYILSLDDIFLQMAIAEAMFEKEYATCH